MRSSRLRALAASLFEAIVALLLLLALLDMLLQVCARAFFPDRAPGWTEEAARILLIWATFIGASTATLKGAHLVVDMFHLRSRVRQIWDIAIALLIGILAVSLLAGTLEILPYAARSITPGLGLPGYVFYLPLTIFAGVVMVAALFDIWSLLHDDHDTGRAGDPVATTGPVSHDSEIR